MQRDIMEEEREMLLSLFAMEDIAEKKAKIYSRLLTEPALAQEMEALSKRHAERKARLQKLATGKETEKEKEDEA